MTAGLREIRLGRGMAWRARQQQVTSLVQQAMPLLDSLGSLPRVLCNGSSETYVPLANTLRSQLEKGVRIKTDASGKPKLGALTPRAIKEAAPLFTGVSVDGVPPTTTPSIDIFLTWAGAERILNALNLAWPDDMVIPPEDTLSERLYWHITELEILDALVAVDGAINNLSERLRASGMSSLEWSDDTQIGDLRSLLDCIAARRDLDAASEPLVQLEAVLRSTTRERGAAPSASTLETAVRERNPGLLWSSLGSIFSTSGQLGLQSRDGMNLAFV